MYHAARPGADCDVKGKSAGNRLCGLASEVAASGGYSPRMPVIKPGEVLELQEASQPGS